MGRRLPNVFVRRGSGEVERELAGVIALAHDLQADEGILIYPEGTRFSPAKRERAIADLQQSGDIDLAERARSMGHVLPPKLAGALARFEAEPAADMVMVGHVGFEGIASARDVASGSLIGRRLRLRYWRSTAPTDPDECAGWFYDRWAELDTWIDESRRDGRSSS